MAIHFKFNRAAGHQAGAAAGGLGGIVFAVVWIGFSSVFVAIGGGLAWKAMVQSAWQRVPCVIDEFQILDDPKQDPPFTAMVTFRYEAGGHPRTGHCLYPATPPTATSGRLAEAEMPGAAAAAREDDYQKLARWQHQYLSARTSTCRVDPHDPNHAALRIKHEDLWGGLAFGGFGLCFVGIGGGVLLQSLRQLRVKRAGAAAGPAITGTRRQATGFPLLIGLPFFGLFAAAGCGMFCFISVPIVNGLLLGPSLVATPATVIWSRVAAHSDSDGTNYKADIFYRYQFDGKEYKSNRSTFTDFSSGGLSGKQDAVRANPPGKTLVCYVNPNKPWAAVRHRGFSWAALFGLFPLPFMAVGLGGLWYLLRRKNSQEPGALTRSASRRPANRFRQATVADGFPRGSREDSSTACLQLAPGKGRLARLLGTLLVAAFWNGIVAVFLWHVVSEWRAGHAPWFLTLFLTPFVLIGLALLGAALHSLGALFNPRPQVSLEPGHPRLGHPLTVAWQIPGGTRRLVHLRIVLRGEEVATYRRGTTTVTERALFHETVVAESATPEMLALGRVAITLPANLMPSWKADNNRIEWTLLVHGRIRHWPDLADTHVLTILPAA